MPKEKSRIFSMNENQLDFISISQLIIKKRWSYVFIESNGWILTMMLIFKVEKKTGDKYHC